MKTTQQSADETKQYCRLANAHTDAVGANAIIGAALEKVEQYQSDDPTEDSELADEIAPLLTQAIKATARVFYELHDALEHQSKCSAETNETAVNA